MRIKKRITKVLELLNKADTEIKKHNILQSFADNYLSNVLHNEGRLIDEAETKEEIFELPVWGNYWRISDIIESERDIETLNRLSFKELKSWAIDNTHDFAKCLESGILQDNYGVTSSIPIENIPKKVIVDIAYRDETSYKHSVNLSDLYGELLDELLEFASDGFSLLFYSKGIVLGKMFVVVDIKYVNSVALSLPLTCTFSLSAEDIMDMAGIGFKCSTDKCDSMRYLRGFSLVCQDCTYVLALDEELKEYLHNLSIKEIPFDF